MGRLSGIWTKFSLMNHSCLINTLKFTIGNFLFVVASKPIKNGEELFTSYIPLEAPLEEKKKLLKFAEFECHCELCEKMKDLDEDTKKMFAGIMKAARDRNTSEENMKKKFGFI